ncbi:hypothetical protein [Paraburkholderia tropica]|uniref:hypothetical protein n=1 Tax=Paraburkholderia tropica TaxID=92647 RepID=UPI001CC49596|nr:hypothetical protein [Paraburkholderia tropica]
MKYPDSPSHVSADRSTLCLIEYIDFPRQITRFEMRNAAEAACEQGGIEACQPILGTRVQRVNYRRSDMSYRRRREWH